jgi:hypothetical protein
MIVGHTLLVVQHRRILRATQGRISPTGWIGTSVRSHDALRRHARVVASNVETTSCVSRPKYIAAPTVERHA